MGTTTAAAAFGWLLFCVAHLHASAQMPPVVRVASYDYTNTFNGAYVNNLSAAPDLAAFAVEGRELIAGIDAAIREANAAGGIHGVPLERVHTETAYQFTHPGQDAEVAQALFGTPNVFAMGAMSLGTSTSVYFNTAFLPPAVQPAVLAAVTPVGLAFNATLSPHMINVRMPQLLDTAVLLEYSTRQMHCKRHGVLYFDDAAALVEVQTYRQKLRDMGYADPPLVPFSFSDPGSLIGNFTVHFNYSSPDPQYRPQCLILLADASSLAFIFGVMTSLPDFDGSVFKYVAPSLTRAADWSGFPGFDQGIYANLVTTAHLPDPYDERFAFTRRFRAAMDELFATGYARPTMAVAMGFAPPSTAPVTYSYFMLEGYAGVRLFVDAARRTSPTNFTRRSIIESFYRTKLFTLDGLPMGPFSDGCDSAASDPSNVYPCVCNSGARRIFVNGVNATTGVTQPVPASTGGLLSSAEFTIPGGVCSDAELARLRPLERPQLHAHVTVPAAASLDGGLRRFSDVFSATRAANLRAAIARQFGRSAVDDIIAVPLSNASDLTGAIPTAYELQSYVAPALPASVADGSLKAVRDFAVFAPLRYRYAVKDDPLPPFAAWNPAYIPLFPTVTDYAVAAVERTSARAPASLRRIRIVGDDAGSVAQARRAVHTRQATPLSETVLFDADQSGAATANATADLADGGAALHARIDAVFAAAGAGDVVVFASQSVPAIGRVLAAWAGPAGAANVTIVLCGSELVVYDALQRQVRSNPAPGDPASTFFVSGLASWVDGGVAYADPAAAYSFLIASAAHVNSGNIFAATPRPADFIAQFYTGRTVGPLMAGTLLGPFRNTSCGSAVELAERPAGSDCQCSKALTAFHVRPLAPWLRAVAASADAAAQLAALAAEPAPDHTHSYTGCAPRFVPLAEDAAEGLSTATVAGLLVAVIIVILAAAAALVVLAGSGKRDNGFAPKDASKPFAMVFTDIQASTTLWARAPKQTAVAVDAHHELIRGVLPATRGYEVKTIGDSFMVAFADPKNAVDFALAVQAVLFDHEWGTEVFDETYKEMLYEAELRRVAEQDQQQENAGVFGTVDSSITGGNTTDSGAFAPPAYDHEVWRGIRVRVGVHYGSGDIKLDPVSQGYDYYGTVVNTAARVESVAHGGQVCITDAVVDALTDKGQKPFPIADAELVRFGPQPLRGLDEPVGLVQVHQKRFAKRVFPPLRLDVEVEDDFISSASSEGAGAADDAVSVVQVDSHSSVGTRKSLGCDDLIEHLMKRVPAAQRPEERRRLRFGRTLFDTLFSLTPPKFRDATLATLADKWRVAPLRRKPGMSRFRRKLGREQVDYVLIASRVMLATASKIDAASESDSQSTARHQQPNLRAPGGGHNILFGRSPSATPNAAELVRRRSSMKPMSLVASDPSAGTSPAPGPTLPVPHEDASSLGERVSSEVLPNKPDVAPPADEAR